MAQVSTQAELQAALNALDSSIQVTAGFSISSQIDILYPVTIESSTPDTPFTLVKDSTYFTYLFRVMQGGVLTLQNIIIDGNSAEHPAADTSNRSLIYVTGGTAALSTGAVLQNNNAYLEGGGIYLNSDASYSNTLIINENARITGCFSRTNGGGIMIAAKNTQDSFSITGNALIANNSSAYGGGIYCRSYAEGIGSAMTLSEQVSITGNTASNAGGGIYFSGYQLGGSTPAALTLSGNVLVSGNKAVHGAGIYYYSANAKDSLALSAGAALTQNTASQNGGGLYMTGRAATPGITLNNALITDNTAGTGGGFYFLTNGGGTASFSESRITGNKAVHGESGTGGGMWIQNQSLDNGLSITITNTNIEHNAASAYGGGAAIYAGPAAFTLDISGGTTADNSADENGGGMLISSANIASLTFHQTNLTRNSSKGSGGAIYYANASVNAQAAITMTETAITDNTASLEGGGLRFTSGSGMLAVQLTDCTVAANTALNNSGGGIWNGGANANLTLNGSTSVIQNISQSGNGGGIYFNSSNGSVLLTDNVKINENRANEVPSDFGNHGGGICLVPGILTINSQVEIAHNEAGKYGGGISAAEESQIIINGGSIHDNSSQMFGGGIWNHSTSTLTVNEGQLYDNKAQFGGSIYNDSVLFMAGERNITDGVYIAGSGAIVQITGALTGTSVIQLESSDYVTPVPEAAPIVVGAATASYTTLTQADADAFRKPPEGFDGWDIILSTDKTQVLLTLVTYQIQYENLRGAVNTNPAFYTVNTPDITLLPPEPLPGSYFLGWYDAPEGGTMVTRIPQGSTGDIILYARWETIPEDYTITFNGNDECCPKATRIPDPITVSSGQSAVLPQVIPVRRGYCFTGWNTDPCGNGTLYLPGALIDTLNTNLTLYAVWCRKRFFPYTGRSAKRSR